MRSLHVNPSAFVLKTWLMHVSGQPQSIIFSCSDKGTVSLCIEVDGFTKSYGTIGVGRDAMYHNVFVRE